MQGSITVMDTISMIRLETNYKFSVFIFFFSEAIH